MDEPHLNPNAQECLDLYCERIARLSKAPYGAADDARRELQAHLADAARTRARRRDDPVADDSDVLQAIQELGSDEDALASFFPTQPVGPRASSVRRTVVGFLALASTLGSIPILLNNLEHAGTLSASGHLVAFAVVGASAFALWSVRGLASMVLAWGLLFFAAILYASIKADPSWVTWAMPAAALILGNALRGDLAFRGAAPEGATRG